VQISHGGSRLGLGPRWVRTVTGAYGRLRRSSCEGDQGQRIWTGWAILAYNLDILAVHTT
jgi:hypothetical protein